MDLGAIVQVIDFQAKRIFLNCCALRPKGKYFENSISFEILSQSITKWILTQMYRISAFKLAPYRDKLN